MIKFIPDHGEKNLHLEKLERRFMKYVRKDESCWEWVGSKSKRGRGQFQVCGSIVGVNRVSYFINFGDVPDGHDVVQSCFNKNCVNPDHLKAELPPTLEERFIKNVNKTDGCWIWTGMKDSKGYGRISKDCKFTLAHRVSYLLYNEKNNRRAVRVSRVR